MAIPDSAVFCVSDKTQASLNLKTWFSCSSMSNESFISWIGLEGMPVMWPWACYSSNANVVVDPKKDLWKGKKVFCVEDA